MRWSWVISIIAMVAYIIIFDPGPWEWFAVWAYGVTCSIDGLLMKKKEAK